MKKLLFCLLLPFSLAAQDLPDSTTRKIDAIFKSYTATTPGCAVAVTKNGVVIFQKGYGLANLEYAVPIAPNTIFHIASESKQYVAFCILLLEKEGKLKTWVFTDRAKLLELAEPVKQAYAKEIDATAILNKVNAIK